MKKLFLILSIVFVVLTGSAFAACDDRGSGLAFSKAEFDKSVTTFDINEDELEALKNEFLKNILAKDSISLDELISDISDNQKFIDYLENKLESIYDALTEFVLNNPDILKEFQDEDGNVMTRDAIKDFFRDFITPEDMIDCLVISIVDADVSEIKIDGDISGLMDEVYKEVEKILNPENINDLLNIIYKQTSANLKDNNNQDLHNIIYNEVKDIVDANSLENLFDSVYNKVVMTISNDNKV